VEIAGREECQDRPKENRGCQTVERSEASFEKRLTMLHSFSGV
jgi:hypothetical protein